MKCRREFEIYIHRIGRSGRFGRKGLAINFVNKRERYNIKSLESFYNTTINELPSDLDSILCIEIKEIKKIKV